METFFAPLFLCEGNTAVTGGFPSHMPVTRSFDASFDLHQDKRLSKQSRRRLFNMPPRSLWCHCNKERVYTPSKNSFRSILAPSVTALILTIFGKALSVNPRVSTSEVSFVLKGMSRIVNFDDWQWVWKHLKIHIRLLKNLLWYNTLLTKIVFFNDEKGNKQNLLSKLHFSSCNPTVWWYISMQI